MNISIMLQDPKSLSSLQALQAVVADPLVRYFACSSGLGYFLGVGSYQALHEEYAFPTFGR